MKTKINCVTFFVCLGIKLILFQGTPLFVARITWSSNFWWWSCYSSNSKFTLALMGLFFGCHFPTILLKLYQTWNIRLIGKIWCCQTRPSRHLYPIRIEIYWHFFVRNQPASLKLNLKFKCFSNLLIELYQTWNTRSIRRI